MQDAAQPEQDSEDGCRSSRGSIVVENKIHCCFELLCTAWKGKELAIKMLIVLRFRIDTRADLSTDLYLTTKRKITEKTKRIHELQLPNPWTFKARSAYNPCPLSILDSYSFRDP
jgi:hypothetical protein